MKSLREVLLEYQSRSIAIPAFNIDCFEIFQAVEKAVAITNLPCIVQTSPSEDKFLQAEKLYMLVKKSQVDGLPIYVNFDHGQDISRLKTLTSLGYDMVHFDGSTTDYESNLSLAQDIRQHSSVLEVEFNHINLSSEMADQFTQPEKAIDFINRSRADLLAVSIGNLHGVNRSSPESLDLELLERIHQSLPGTFLTLHGGSGIPSDQVTAAIRLGIVKININTDLRLTYLATIRQSLAQISSEKVYDYLYPVIDAVQSVATQKLLQFSTV